jgi:hypothetical protein
MSDLWNPTEEDKKSLAAGQRKVRLSTLKPNLENCLCPYCDSAVYYYRDRHKYMTLNGSDHRCKAMPDK